MSTTGNKKLILIVGATGTQGSAVIDALLAPTADGQTPLYSIRALTQGPKYTRAQELAAKGVECVQARYIHGFDSVEKAMKGVYGAWINTDGSTVGEQEEVFAGMRIFEPVKRVGTLRHYVYSSLDYSLKLGDYNTDYKVNHFDGKARVDEWLKAQPSNVTDNGMTWTVVTSGLYMEMLNMYIFGPLNWREDGTAVFASPIGQGHVPMIALSDIGYFALYTFDNRSLLSGRNLEVTSDIVGWDYLVDTFKRLTAKNTVFVPQTVDQWFSNFNDVDRPMVHDPKITDVSTTWKENFSSFWQQWRDDIITRDTHWIRSINPNGRTLESWMRKSGNDGQISRSVLKNIEDGKGGGINWEKVRALRIEILQRTYSHS